MSRIAVLGAGAGGAAAAVELTQRGFDVALWNRSERTLAPFQARGGVVHEGVLGEGFVPLSRITADLQEAVAGAQAILVCLPTFTHGEIARQLAEAGIRHLPVVMNPGHTGGALEFRHAFTEVDRRLPPVAEFSTLTYVARKCDGATVRVTGRAKQVRVGALPGGAEALVAAQAMFPNASPVADVLAADLANANLVLHPPGAVLGAAWVEATQGDFTFYVQGMTPGVARVMARLDDERRATARAFGHEMPSLVDEMRLIGTVEGEANRVGRADDPAADLVTAIAGGQANQRIKAPDSLQHRYYLEDFGHGLVPFIALSRVAGVPTPTADALLGLGEALTGTPFRQTGRTAQRMGIDQLDRAGLLALVREHGHD
ncbi:Opine dehydrogenase [Pandoraea terrae]|uniref:Opine dehydrogenase n=1 Tax=Pandoraea terrae TaxID=1537710 RepID=A0A5E4ZED8_9BURK|nr:NAD/NADP octopine/nopaline dehydrogenase family protein [Pandoraea terrae]VVE59659.1 Opine dehydrogenase [Pandoraea terrae]